MWKKMLTTLLLCVLLSSCATGGSRTKQEPRRADPTILVHNEGLTSVAVYVEGRRMATTVQPGQSGCVVLRGTSQSRHTYLGFKAVTENHVELGPRFDPASQAGWAIWLGPWTNRWVWDVQTLEPAPRCKAVRRRNSFN